MGNTPERARYRFFVSHHHKLAAEHFMSLLPAYSEDPARIQIVRPLCVATVTSAVGFMECWINEFYSEFSSFGTQASTLSVGQRRQFVAFSQSFDWDRRLTILQKYAAALAVLAAEPMDRGKRPYQDADLLVKFRNSLVHHLPYVTEVDLGSGQRKAVHALEAKLRPRIGPSPADLAEKFYPDNCLHSQCAEWAVTTATTFVEDFLRRLGIPRLKTYVGSALFE